jgi:hypothetical protein
MATCLMKAQKPFPSMTTLRASPMPTSSVRSASSFGILWFLTLRCRAAQFSGAPQPSLVCQEGNQAQHATGNGAPQQCCPYMTVLVGRLLSQANGLDSTYKDWHFLYGHHIVFTACADAVYTILHVLLLDGH